MEHAPRLDRPVPWRGLTAILAVVATAELLGLLALAGVHLVPSHSAPAATKTKAPVSHARPAVHAFRLAPAHPLRPRSAVSVLVLNGNGVSGAAGAAASRLLARGYRRATATDAPNHDYARSLVLFAPGWQREGQRLARELHIGIVGALDGMKRSQLRGSQLVVILGGS